MYETIRGRRFKLGAAHSGIVMFIPKLFVAILILVILIFAFMHVVRRQDDIEKDLEDARNEIITARQNRYQLMTQVIDLFGNGNPDVGNLTKLRDIYTMSSSEEEEIMWEEKYVLIMRRFMEHAGSHLRPELKQAYEMSSKAVEDNERALSQARQKYESAKKQASAYAKPPLLYLAAAGDKIADAMRFHHTVVTNMKEESPDGETDEE